MNDSSSRSHAIFTLTLKQSRICNEENCNDDVTSKFHFVDLAGSENLKNTGASDKRKSESKIINLSLF